MIKFNVKKLAVEFAKLRPDGRAGDAEFELWHNMIVAASNFVPGDMAQDFITASRGYGIWPK